MTAPASLKKTSRRSRPANAGFVLVLAMLILIVLSGMGIYGLRTSRIDLRSAANMRLGASAEYVAEAAMQSALTQLSANPQSYLTQVAAQPSGSWSIPSTPGMFNETTTTYDSFGLQKGVMPQWTVTLSRAVDVSPAALTGTLIGSVGGTTARFRMKRLDVTATGTLYPRWETPTGDGGMTVNTGTSAVNQRTSTEQVRSHVVIGPL